MKDDKRGTVLAAAMVIIILGIFWVSIGWVLGVSYGKKHAPIDEPKPQTTFIHDIMSYQNEDADILVNGENPDTVYIVRWIDVLTTGEHKPGAAAAYSQEEADRMIMDLTMGHDGR